MSAKRIKSSSSAYSGSNYDGEQESEATPECTEGDEVIIGSSDLDCPICFDPLQLPLFQCINGHVACSACSAQLVGKCPVCSASVTSRCIPFESVIRSNKAKCPYAKSGCAISLPHNKIATHVNKCMYAPCTCPIPDCNFRCEGFLLSRHMVAKHVSFKQMKVFDHDQWFSVLVEKEQPFILQGINYVYVLLSRRIELSGYAFWIAHLCASAEMSYELVVQSGDGNTLNLKGTTKYVTNLDEEALPEFFMYVPRNVFTFTGHLSVKIKMSL